MTIDEEDAAILRVVKGKAEARKRKSLLESELHAAGASLSKIGFSLEGLGDNSALARSPAALIARVREAPRICDLSKIEEMLVELKQINENLEHLSATARELGIE